VERLGSARVDGDAVTLRTRRGSGVALVHGDVHAGLAQTLSKTEAGESRADNNNTSHEHLVRAVVNLRLIVYHRSVNMQMRPRREHDDLADRLGVPTEVRPLVGAIQRFRAATAVQTMELWLRLDLTIPQFAALHSIWRLGSVNGRQLADQLGISAPAVVKVCDRLEARGLIERVRDHRDRRVQWLQLTASGANVFTQLVAMTREHMLPALKRLSARDRASLTRLLNALADSIETEG
jgi:DNA-binding MarR family transcriptional regulator